MPPKTKPKPKPKSKPATKKPLLSEEAREAKSSKKRILNAVKKIEKAREMKRNLDSITGKIEQLRGY